MLRAFTTTAFAFHRGVNEIYLVSTVEEAFELKQQQPDLLLAGEVDGYSIDGFDFPNSPTVINEQDLDGHRLVLRTTAGTQGVVRASKASFMFVAGLSNATATADAIRLLQPELVSFVDSGVRPKGGGEEDTACSDYIESLIRGVALSVDCVKNRVRASKAATKFTDENDVDFLASDLDLALEVDRFSFAMEVSWEDDHLILRKRDVSFYR